MKLSRLLRKFADWLDEDDNPSVESVSTAFRRPTRELIDFKRGDRVLINQTSGFSRGHKGTVEFVEPRGQIWVIRDGSGGPVYFHNHELDLLS
jgi:hypothetical protein